MDADKKVKKGTAEKRSVRKATKTNLKPTKEVDLKAAAEGTDVIRPDVAESPTAPRKRVTRRGLEAPSAKPAALGKGAPAEEPTVEQIQLRAYFISERRKSAGLPGDETGDWVQAREELRSEPRGS
ncbi:MAG TPA: hypothetical protein VGD78_16035 [Chthoniobacterales bacterium]